MKSETFSRWVGGGGGGGGGSLVLSLRVCWFFLFNVEQGFYFLFLLGVLESKSFL